MVRHWIQIVCIMSLFSVPSASATTNEDYYPDDNDAHDDPTATWSLEGVGIESNGTHVNVWINTTGLSTSMAETEYKINLENRAYESIWVECRAEGTGTSIAASCIVRYTDDPCTDQNTWDTYYSIGVPILATHRLSPCTGKGSFEDEFIDPLKATKVIPHDVHLDTSGEIGATFAYSDTRLTSGESLLIGNAWVSDPNGTGTRDGWPQNSYHVLA